MICLAYCFLAGSLGAALGVTVAVILAAVKDTP